MGKYLDLTGQVFGRLTAIERLGKNSYNKIDWLCRCECGKETKTTTNNLTSGNSTSCGCKREETIHKVHTKHGESLQSGDSPEYRTWLNIRARIDNPKSTGYQNYGGRGIKMCRRWRGKNGFINFLSDMGRKPSQEHSIDRINVNGHYEPSNCRWATRIEQANNTRRQLAVRAIYQQNK